MIREPPRREREYVPVPQETRRCWALQEALKLVVRKYPGTEQTVVTIENLAQQIEAGRPETVEPILCQESRG